MRDRGFGRVIQLASGEATQPFAFMPDNAAAKASLVNLTVSLAQELAGSGVTANTVSPGIVVTAGVEGFYREADERLGPSWPGIEAGVLRDVLRTPSAGSGESRRPPTSSLSSLAPQRLYQRSQLPHRRRQHHEHRLSNDTEVFACKPFASTAIPPARRGRWSTRISSRPERDDLPVIAAAGVDAVIRRDDALKEQILRPMFGDEWPQQRMFPNRAVSDGETLEFGGASFTVIDLGPSESPHDSIWLHGCRAPWHSPAPAPSSTVA